MTTHEDLKREIEVHGSSDRSFGLVFAAVFLAIGLWPLVRGGTLRAWAPAVAVAFLVAALARPSLLAPLNRLWTRFGLLLGKVTTPIVMGILFYLVVTPTGLLMRLFGKDPLRLSRDPEAGSYWIQREPPGPSPETMSNQF
jgi:hypothetical protein